MASTHQPNASKRKGRPPNVSRPAVKLKRDRYPAALRVLLLLMALIAVFFLRHVERYLPVDFRLAVMAVPARLALLHLFHRNANLPRLRLLHWEDRRLLHVTELAVEFFLPEKLFVVQMAELDRTYILHLRIVELDDRLSGLGGRLSKGVGKSPSAGCQNKNNNCP